jgi:uncharacterized repeat protein (TIGR03803 family)
MFCHIIKQAVDCTASEPAPTDRETDISRLYVAQRLHSLRLPIAFLKVNECNGDITSTTKRGDPLGAVSWLCGCDHFGLTGGWPVSRLIFNGATFFLRMQSNGPLEHNFVPAGAIVTHHCLIAKAKASSLPTNVRRITAVLAFAIAGTVLIFGSQFALAVNFETLYSFPSDVDGFPYAGLLLDSAGNLYGTGAGNACFYPTYAWGNVFEIDANGNESVLYSFNGTGGRCPFDAVIEDQSGNLYGTTYEGGTYGEGNLFQLDPTGHETTLYSFNPSSGTADGCSPYAGLLRDASGNLYGTTYNCGAFQWGIVFKIDPSGNETILHNFAGGDSDGGYPYGGLITDAAGNFYGTTEVGGGSGQGSGVLYKLTKKGKIKLLHRFSGTNGDGCHPIGTPLRDKAGNFYGTTTGCGAFGSGIVWKVSKDGNETVLHSFAGGQSDGATPSDAGLIADAKGNLYGVTSNGGPSNVGTVYKLNEQGRFTLLHAFTLAADSGQNPQGSVVMDAKGNLYGTTPTTGDGNGNGTVWKLVR